VNDAQRLALLRSAVDNLERTEIGFVEYDETGRGSEWRLAMRKLSRLEHDLAPDPVPNLGPLVRGGRSLLNVSLTHATEGIAKYPAFDEGWRLGLACIAPEPLVVIAPYTSSSPGAAFYARGESKLRYWFGHLTASPRIGRRFAKGEVIGKICPQYRPDGSANHHLHAGVNVELLLGAGRTLLYGRDGDGPDYTTGAPTIGAQLRRWMI
jgi:hypothetical protein